VSIYNLDGRGLRDRNPTNASASNRVAFPRRHSFRQIQKLTDAGRQAVSVQFNIAPTTNFQDSEKERHKSAIPREQVATIECDATNLGS
jgi:hypothetical protein